MRFHRTLYAVSAGLALGAFCAAAIGDEVADRAKDPNLWAAPGGDQALTRHSALKAISTSNVGQLQMIWSQSSGTLRGHEGQPLVVDDVGGKPMMYIESGWPNIVQALDLTDPDHPKEVWNYNKTSDRDESAVPRACCDTVNRGMSYADGKLVFGTLDGFVIALDAVTGKEDWVVKHAYPDKGETITPAPIIAERQGASSVSAATSSPRVAASPPTTSPTARRCGSATTTGSDKDVCLTQNTNKKHPEYGTAGKDLGISQLSGRRVEARRRRGVGLVQLRPGPAARVLRSTGNPGLWSPSVSLRRDADHAGSLQQRQVGQQVVDDDLRAQRRYRRSRMGLPDDAVRPVGL